MSALKAANVTKYDAGGSGDDIISDGLIKTVEKVWIDSYVCTQTLATTDSICIGIVPASSHLTDVIVYLPATHSLDTLCTVYLSTGQTVATTTYFGSLVAAGFATTTHCGGTAATLRLAGAYMDKALPTDSTTQVVETKLYITVHPSDSDSTVTTIGTIRSIIKYTR